jgi:predicted nucleotide-binding protein
LGQETNIAGMCREEKAMPHILIIDDDLAMDVLGESLRFRGHEVERIASANQALERIKEIAKADLIILDIIMAWPDGRLMTGLAAGSSAGMEILLEIRKRNHTVPILAYSATQDATVIDAIRDSENCTFVSKWEGHSLRELLTQIHGTLGLPDDPTPPQSFIIHGHDDSEKLELKNFIQNTLHFPEPLILHEQPNWGRTIIEKFEHYAAMSTLVFVLLTPDDIVANGDETDDMKRQARQNVIFEMGFFLGALGRETGRIILLYKPPLDLPSDISGVIYIDIAAGIEASGEKIRKEITHVTK